MIERILPEKTQIQILENKTVKREILLSQAVVVFFRRNSLTMVDNFYWLINYVLFTADLFYLVAGIGLVQQVVSQIQESCSVYVNNLPSDITQEELGILIHTN